jgi:Tol biopolymer transport system component
MPLNRPVLLLCLLSFAGCSGHEDGPRPPQPAAEELTFVRRTESGAEHLYSIRPGKGSARPLESTLRGALQDPDWSPDGSRVAFRFLASGDYENTRVQVMDADGSGLVDLSTRSGIRGSSPSWSPDAGRIAFSGKRAGDARESIWVVDADGANAERLTDPGREAQYPAWSPDGRRIAFTFVADGGFDVYVMNADGSSIRALARSPEAENWPVWSPDSRRVAYGVEAAAGSWVRVVDADGTKRTTVFGPRRRAGVPMAWSPGARLAVNCSGRRDDDIGICTVDADGSRFRRVVDDGGFPGWRPTRRMRSAEPR